MANIQTVSFQQVTFPLEAGQSYTGATPVAVQGNTYVGYAYDDFFTANSTVNYLKLTVQSIVITNSITKSFNIDISKSYTSTTELSTEEGDPLQQESHAFLTGKFYATTASDTANQYVLTQSNPSGYIIKRSDVEQGGFCFLFQFRELGKTILSEATLNLTINLIYTGLSGLDLSTTNNLQQQLNTQMSMLLDVTGNKIPNLQAQIEAIVEEDISELTAAINLNITNIATLQASSTSQASSIATLQSLTSTQSTNITNLQSLTSTQTTNINNLQTEVEAILTKNTDQDSRLDALETTVATHNETLSEFNDQIDTLQTQMDNTITTVTDHESRLQSLETSQPTQDQRLTALEEAVSDQITAQTQRDSDQDTRLDAVELANSNQDTRLDDCDTLNSEQNGRLDAIETVNSNQDSTLSTLTTQMTSVLSKNTTQDTRLTDIETLNTTQDTRLTNIETLDATQNTRLTNIETLNTTQNTSIGVLNSYFTSNQLNLYNLSTTGASSNTFLTYDGEMVSWTNNLFTSTEGFNINGTTINLGSDSETLYDITVGNGGGTTSLYGDLFVNCPTTPTIPETLNYGKVVINSNAVMGETIINYGDGSSGALKLGNPTGNILVDATIQMDGTGYKITNVLDPTSNQDVATKKYVDDNIGGIDQVITYDPDNLLFNNTSTNLTALIATVPNVGQLALSPRNSNYTLTADTTISTGQIKIYGFNTGISGGNNNVFIQSSNKLIITSAVRFYASNISFNCPVEISTKAIGNFENCSFNQGLTFKSITGYVTVNNCSLASAVTFDSNLTSGSIFLFNCNYSGITWTNNIPLGAFTVLIYAGINLPSFSLGNMVMFSNIVTTASDSRVYTVTPGFYNTLTGSKYLMTDADISSSAAIAQSKISGLSSALSTLNGYFTSSKLNLANLTGGSSAGQFLTYNGTNPVWGTSLTNGFSVECAIGSQLTLINSSSTSGTLIIGNSTRSTNNLNQLWGGGLFLNTPVIAASTTTGHVKINDQGSSGSVMIASEQNAVPSTGTVYLGNSTGNVTVYGNINMQNSKTIIGLPNPTVDSNPVSWGYFKDYFLNLPSATLSTDLINKNYLDTLPAPTVNTDIITYATMKDYTLNAVQAIGWSGDIGTDDYSKYIVTLMKPNAGTTLGSGIVSNRKTETVSNFYSSFGVDNNGTFTAFSNSNVGMARIINYNNSSVTLSNSGVWGSLSSRDFKTSIKNKSKQYISEADQPIKNYYAKILDTDIYTFAYKKKDENGDYTGEPCKEIVQGYIWEEVYDKFGNLGCQQRLDSDINKPSMENVSQDEKMIYHQNMIPYIMLALQEQKKFIIDPMQERLKSLEDEVRNLKGSMSMLLKRKVTKEMEDETVNNKPLL